MIAAPEKTEGAFRDVVTSKEALRALMGEPTELVLRKQLSALEVHSRAFIARSPFVCVATARTGGGLDISPRGDPPGFVRVLDERTWSDLAAAARARAVPRHATPTCAPAPDSRRCHHNHRGASLMRTPASA